MTKRLSMLALATALSIFAGAMPLQADPILYGSAYLGTTGPSTLYSIDPTNGAATAIGPIGFNRVGGIDFNLQTGILYGVGHRTSDNAFVLVTIDPTTGLGTEVGALGAGISSGVGVQDISFRSDGVLFAFINASIYTIDTSTGAATLLGPVASFQNGNALGFTPTDTLLSVNEVDVRTVNQTTGATSFVVATSYLGPLNDEPRTNAMDLDTATGKFWASVANHRPVTTSYLAMVDPATGVVTAIGPTILGLDAITVAVAVPEPASAILICGGLVALSFIKRRRH
jgi:hypothetical protein